MEDVALLPQHSLSIQRTGQDLHALILCRFSFLLEISHFLDLTNEPYLTMQANLLYLNITQLTCKPQRS